MRGIGLVRRLGGGRRRELARGDLGQPFHRPRDEEWAGTLRELDRDAQVVYAMFNNNGRSGAGEVPDDLSGGLAEVAQAPTNAAMLKALL